MIGVVKGGKSTPVIGPPRPSESGRQVMPVEIIPSGINYAVPINRVKEMIETIKTTTHEDIMQGKEKIWK